MDNKKNVILAVILCVGILVAWQWLFPPPRPTAPAPGKEVATEPAERAAPARPSKADDGEAPASEGQGAAAVRGEEQIVTLASEAARYQFTSWGGTLRAVELLGDKFTRDGKPLEIARTDGAEQTSFALTFPKSGFELPEDVAWNIVDQGPRHVVFRAETDKVRVSKRYELAEGRFRLNLLIELENLADKTVKPQLVMHVYGRQDPQASGGGFFTYATASPEEMVCLVGDSVERTNLEKLREDPLDKEGAVRWIAADERFFTIAAVAPELAANEVRKCGQRAQGLGGGEVFVSLGERKLDPGATLKYPFALYVGAKYRAEMATVNVPRVEAGGAVGAAGDAELDRVVNVTFAFLSKPMLALLKLFFTFTNNWGLAIILLTLLVRVITFYPAHKQLLSGKKMARLAPRLTELRAKYGDDRQRMGVETMNLYKTHGVNPLGGCLPALIQMPIWIALFSTLSYSVELYHSAFALHIQDLSKPDPYFAAPLIMGAVMFVQMRMSPAGADPQQQKMMSIMMPVMFTAFSLFLPAGLAIYTLTSYLLGILHQLLVNHLDRKANPHDPLPGKRATKVTAKPAKAKA